MQIVFGNSAPHSTLHEAVDASIGHDALLALAAEKGVLTTVDADSTDLASDEMIAARLSSVPTYEPISGQKITTYDIPDDYTLLEHVGIVQSDWSYHSTQIPLWVECEASPVLAAICGEQFSCQVGRPDGWVET